MSKSSSSCADDLFPSEEEIEVTRASKSTPKRPRIQSSSSDEECQPKKKTKQRSGNESRASSSSMPLLAAEEPEEKHKKSVKSSSKQVSKSSAERSEQRAPKKTKTQIRPVSRPTARELFGTDSDDDEQEAACASKKSNALISSITRRLANGVSRQTFSEKEGSHYVELKVYKVTDIEKIAPMNRWRQAVMSLKYKTNDDTEAWSHLTKFIGASRKEFKNIPPTFISNYF